MERPLYTPPVKPVITARVLSGEGAGVDADALFDQVVVDRAELRANIRRLLQARFQVTLSEVIGARPLTHGLAELVTYLAIAGADGKAVFDETRPERVPWRDEAGTVRRATGWNSSRRSTYSS